MILLCESLSARIVAFSDRERDAAMHGAAFEVASSPGDVERPLAAGVICAATLDGLSPSHIRRT